MRFLIPSYKRAGRATSINFLRAMGVADNDILVGVQTEEDLVAYRRAYPRVVLCYRSANNCAGNRNNLLARLEPGERAVLLDDDCRRVLKLGDDGRWKRLVTAHEFAGFIQHGFEIAGDGLWAPCVTTNFIRQLVEKGEECSQSRLLPGQFFGFTNDGSVRFDESLPFLDDCEAMAHALLDEGKCTYRLNRYCIPNKDGLDTAGGDGSNGGCSGQYARVGVKGEREVFDSIIARWPGSIVYTNNGEECARVELTRAERKRLAGRYGKACHHDEQERI